MAKRSPQSWFLSGGAANEGEFLRAARRTGALILIAPSIKSARTWLDRCTSPVEDSGRRDESIAPDGLVVDLQSQQAEWRGNSLELTTQELRLLAALAGPGNSQAVCGSLGGGLGFESPWGPLDGPLRRPATPSKAGLCRRWSADHLRSRRRLSPHLLTPR